MEKSIKTSEKLDTPLYQIEVPPHFDTILLAGQLLRCERRLKPPEEASVSELNFWVGAVEDNQLDLTESASSEDVLSALWGDHLRKEERNESLPADHLILIEREAHRLAAILKVAPTSWRPESGQLVIFQLFESSPLVYSSFHLEFAWSHQEFYRDLGKKMHESLNWKKDLVNVEGLKLQSQASYSKAPPRAIPEALQRIIEAKKPKTPETLDLFNLASEKITSDLIKEKLISSGDSEWTCLLQVPCFPDPIEFTLADLPDIEALPAELVELVKWLANLGTNDRKRAADLLWDHCQLCFEDIDYGAEDCSNQEYFGIHNAEDAFSQAGPASVYINWEMGYEPGLRFYPVWEDEHGCTLKLEDGHFTCWTE